jgi:hypothetical protein
LAVHRDTLIGVPGELVKRTEDALDFYGSESEMLDCVSTVLNRFRILIEEQQKQEIFGSQ